MHDAPVRRASFYNMPKEHSAFYRSQEMQNTLFTACTINSFGIPKFGTTVNIVTAGHSYIAHDSPGYRLSNDAATALPHQLWRGIKPRVHALWPFLLRALLHQAHP